MNSGMVYWSASQCQWETTLNEDDMLSHIRKCGCRDTEEEVGVKQYLSPLY